MYVVPASIQLCSMDFLSHASCRVTRSAAMHQASLYFRARTLTQLICFSVGAKLFF
jgi:hypothetical protein